MRELLEAVTFIDRQNQGLGGLGDEVSDGRPPSFPGELPPAPLVRLFPPLWPFFPPLCVFLPSVCVPLGACVAPVLLEV